jgi:circadian clock protein KaiC
VGQSGNESGRAASGIAGLDDILGGGFPRNRMYLVEGDPGAGKTTLALQFLIEGMRAGEPTVYVLLSETEEELRSVAMSHGWSLDGIAICDLQASEENLQTESQYTLFHPAEVELSDTTKIVLDAVRRVKPKRVVFDSLSEMRLLARDPLRYRRQILALKAYFTARQCTVLLLDYQNAEDGDRQLRSLCHGVVGLQSSTPAYGGQRRRLRIQKLRGVTFRDGYHDYSIRTGGLEVHPRLVASEHHQKFSSLPVLSGVGELDALLGGGIHRGTSTLFLGPAGVGKSTLTAQYVMQALENGERASVYIFDEVPNTFMVRGQGLGMRLGDHLSSGNLRLRQVDPAEMSPGQFARSVRDDVEKHEVTIVAIDSLNGYAASMPNDLHLNAHLHELLAYLNQQGVLTLLVVSQYGILGETVTSPIELSYLADTVVLLRYFEARGEIRKAISVVKKRTGPHEKAVRELNMGADGIRVGNQLREFQGVLTGQLVYTGRNGGSLLEDEDAQRE